MIPETTQKIIEIKRTSASACGAFRLFLPMQEQSKVLVMDEFFCGGTSIALSRHFEIVICLCSDPEKAKQIQKRINSLEIYNIVIVTGTPDAAPFKFNSFSMICLHGMRGILGQPNLIGSNFFYYLLQNNGILYISYEFNPITVSSKMMRLIMKIAIERRIKILGLKKISTLQHYESFSNLHYVREFKTTKHRSILEFYNYTKDRIKGKNNGLVFQKRNNIREKVEIIPLIQRIRTDIELIKGTKLKAATLVRIGSTGSLVVDFGSVIVRLPQSNSAEGYCNRNFEMLHRFTGSKSTLQMPVPIAEGFLSGQTYYAETKIPGTSMDTTQVSLKKIPIIIHQAYLFLTSSAVVTGRMESSAREIMVENLFLKIDYIMEKKHKIILDKVRSRIQKKVSDHSLPLVICHGDFKFSNFICDRSSAMPLVGIIDWEFGSMPGLPLYDLITMLIWNGKGRNEIEYRIVKRIWDLVNTMDFDPLLMEYMKVLKIDVGLLKPLSILSMIAYLNNAFYPEIKNTGCWYHEMVSECLMPACEIFLSKI